MEPALCRSDLASLLAEAGRRAAKSGWPALVSLSVPSPRPLDPIGIFAAAAHVAETRTFFSRGAKGWIVTAGRVAGLRVDGADRFHRAMATQRAISSSAVVDHRGGCPKPGPMFIGSFRFGSEAARSGPWREIPHSLVVLPKWVFFQERNKCWITLNRRVEREAPGKEPLAQQLECELGRLLSPSEPSSNPPILEVRSEPGFNPWRRAVEEILARIRNGELAKVTLARTLKLSAAAPLRPEPALRRLLHDYPHCFVFAVCRGETCFLGATPELLVSLRRGRVRSVCMAGSAWRSAGHGADDSEEILSSHKERSEHSLTAQWVSERLGALCNGLSGSAAPEVVAVGPLRHLATSFTGFVEGKHILELVSALHPTPAVGGLPLEAALEAIGRLERFDRGWYAGPIGWSDRRGEGEFAIAIRSALLRGGRAFLYAGAGIVAGSDAEREYEETGMKFRPLLAALGVF